MVFRLCREVNGEIVDLLEIEAEDVQEAVRLYRERMNGA